MRPCRPTARLLPLLLLLAAPVTGASAAPAERIFVGGSVVTVADATPRAEAVAVSEGRIVAVGNRADVERLRGPATEVVDLGGRTLVPGFVDGHSHFFSLVDVQTQALCASPPAGTCRSVADVIAALRGIQERRKLGPGQFVMGFGCDPDLLAEKRWPTKAELDRAFPDNPVFIVHVSGHGAQLNSKALAAYGVSAATPTPGVLSMRRCRPASTLPGPHSTKSVTPEATIVRTVATQRTGLASCR